jgi:hypothetical protein
MNIKNRVEKLEQNQAMRESVEEIPESLSPREQYLRLINAPIKTIKAIKTDKTKPSRTYTPEEAYAAMTGKDDEH